jgi:hypothetical protein
MLPCGVAVVLRVMAPADVDAARRRATRRAKVDTTLGLAIDRQINAQAATMAAATAAGQQAAAMRTEAERLLKAKPDHAEALEKLASARQLMRQEVGIAIGRLRQRLLAQDPEAFDALESLQAWNLALVTEVAGAALVECAALADPGEATWRPATPAEAITRLEQVQPEEAQGTLLGHIYSAAKKLSETGTLGKAPSAPPSGSTTVSGETGGAVGAETARRNG